MLKVLHVINSLRVGGAELVLVRLVKAMERSRFETLVVCLQDDLTLAAGLRERGIEVCSLGLSGGWSTPRSLTSLGRILRRFSPDVVQTWLYHSDLLGGLMARLFTPCPVIWNLRHSNLATDLNKRATLAVVAVCARLSNWLPARIVCGSHAARRAHIAGGYSEGRMVTIPNGCDCILFVPDPNARQAMRRTLNVPEGDLLVGHVARFDSQKDTRTFLLAARALRRRLPNTHFVLSGSNMDTNNQVLSGWIEDASLHDRIHLLGRTSDMPSLYAALDLKVSSSRGEGFPNAIAEAMACGVPVVATDAGDSALIVGDAERIVAPSDAESLSRACGDFLSLPEAVRKCVGGDARRRIVERFGLPSVVDRYEQLYLEVSSRCAA